MTKKKTLRTTPVRDMYDEPDPKDDNDPAYREELFETSRAIGIKPEDFVGDPAWAKRYAKWLKTHPFKK